MRTNNQEGLKTLLIRREDAWRRATPGAYVEPGIHLGPTMYRHRPRALVFVQNDQVRSARPDDRDRPANAHPNSCLKEPAVERSFAVGSEVRPGRPPTIGRTRMAIDKPDDFSTDLARAPSVPTLWGIGARSTDK